MDCIIILSLPGLQETCSFTGHNSHQRKGSMASYVECLPWHTNHESGFHWRQVINRKVRKLYSWCMCQQNDLFYVLFNDALNTF